MQRTIILSLYPSWNYTTSAKNILSMSSLRQLQSQCKGKLASTSLTATSKISASNLTAKGVQKRVYFYLSHNNCKSCITQRLSLPQLHQQQHRCYRTFISTSVPATVKQQRRKVQLNLCFNNCQADTNNNFSQP